MSSTRLTKIGKYEVLDVIGRGGMGVVYKAVDPAIGRLVAIKMITAGFADDPNLLKRFYREAQSTGSLQHQNIVTVYDLGDDSGIPYLVMEFLEGETLENVIRSRKEMFLAEKLSLMVQACDGLHYAHHRNVVHRDIKPANMILPKGGGLKIVDFGIARFGNERFTRTGQVMGSIYYMSPEQINGEETDARTDIYSTGIVLFEFLTGELPFRGKDTASTLMKILRDPVPPLSTYLRGYPAELDQIIARALTKDRNQRYPTIEEFAFDLQRLQEETRRELIGGYLRSAQAYIEQSDWTRAKENLRHILRLDRQNTRANELVREVQSRIQKQQVQEQVRQLRNRAEEAVGLRQWDEALGYLEQAITLQSEPDLVQRRDSIQQSRVQLSRALSAAEAAHRAGDLDHAQKAIEDALAVDPLDTNARALRAIINKELADRAKQKQIDGLVAEANKEIAAQHFTAAIEILSKAHALDPVAPEIQQLVAFANTAREQQKRKAALEAETSAIERLLNRDEFGAAVAKADEALLKFPRDAGLQRLRAFAEKQREAWAKRLFIESQISAARELFEAGDAPRAAGILHTALEKYPADPNLTSLLSIVQDSIAREDLKREEGERRKQEQEREIERALLLARSLAESSQAAKALDILEDAQQRFPTNPQIRAYAAAVRDSLKREQLEREKSEAERVRRRAVEAEIRTADSLVAQKQLRKALELLENASVRYPGDEGLQGRVTSVRKLVAQEEKEQEKAAREAQRRSEEILAEARHARSLLARGRAQDARSTLQSALKNFGDDSLLQQCLAEANDLLQQQEAARQQHEAERQRAAEQRQREEEQRRREELERIEQTRASRRRDLSELDALTQTIPTLTDASALRQLSRRLGDLRDKYVEDPVVQSSVSYATQLLDTRIAGLHTSQTQPAASPTRLFGSTGVAEPKPDVSSLPEARPAIRVPSPRPADRTEALRAKTPRPQPSRLRLVLIAAVCLAVVVGALVIKKLVSGPTTTSVRIVTDPHGAHITVGGNICVDPNCEMRLSAGNYVAQANLDGYQPASQPFTVEAGRRDITITISLPKIEVKNNNPPPVESKPTEPSKPKEPSQPKEKALPSLVISAAIPGSAVFVDDQVKGNVNGSGMFTANVAPGDHRIKIVAGNRESNSIVERFLAGNVVQIRGSEFSFPTRQPDEAADWDRIRNSQDPEQVSRFLEKYPNGRLRSTAEARQEDLYWGRDQAADTQGSLRDYLRRYPGGKYSASATQELAKLDWQAIANTNDRAALQNYLKMYPSGSYHDQAESRLEDLIWYNDVHSNDADSLRRYLQMFPSGKFADEAKKSLARLAELNSKPKDNGQAERPVQNPQSNVDDKTAILNLLKAYSSSYESEDLDSMRRIWPRMTAEQSQGFQDFFKNANSVKMTYILVGNPKISGNNATLQFKQEITYVMNGGFQKPKAEKITMTLTKAATGAWQIGSIH